MASGMKWNGRQFEQRLRKATADGLLRAGTFYHAKCREAVSKPNTGRSVRVVRKVKVRTRKDGQKDKRFKGFKKVSKTIYPNPSKPGESPRLRTGFGRANVVVNHKGGRNPHARIGVSRNGMYMFWLEVGTRRVARRPWLVKALLENKEVIGKLAATGGKK